jgi:hypothetical protein
VRLGDRCFRMGRFDIHGIIGVSNMGKAGVSSMGPAFNGVLHSKKKIWCPRTDHFRNLECISIFGGQLSASILLASSFPLACVCTSNVTRS